MCAREQLVSERDKSIRAAALGTLEILHGAEGSAAAWRVIGSISNQQRSLIEERFRHSEKQAARATAASRQATGSSASSSQRTTDDAEVPCGRCRPPALCLLAKLRRMPRYTVPGAIRSALPLLPCLLTQVLAVVPESCVL